MNNSRAYGICRLVFLLVFACFSTGLQAQRIRVSQVLVPDSVVLGSTIVARVNVVNEGSAPQLGEMRLWMRNPELGTAKIPLGYFSAQQYFAPSQEREFIVSLPIRPDVFKGGGNTVVIWPSFIDRPELEYDSTLLDVFVIDPNHTTGIADIQKMLRIMSRPGAASLEVFISGNLQQPVSFGLYDLEGRKLRYTLDNQIDMTGLSAGIYLLELEHGQGILTRHKIFWPDR